MRVLQSSRWGNVILDVIMMLVAFTEGDPCKYKVPHCSAWHRAAPSSSSAQQQGLT